MMLVRPGSASTCTHPVSLLVSAQADTGTQVIAGLLLAMYAGTLPPATREPGWGSVQ